MSYAQEFQAIEHGRDNRMAALAVYGLYALTIPTAATLAIVGVIVAYVARGGAEPIARAHFDRQIRMFWMTALWGAVLFLLSLPAWILTLVLIGIPMLWPLGAVWFLVLAWLTIASVFGALRLWRGAAPG
ncbi:MAG: hypothetical protein GC206_05470 [Alphaproteobacteria bacterium]|nr:hypothetical protein [Alphaproteobacteria bacterium]